ncbi:MAG: acyltransferase family protein, partial [Acidimicrobiales bacterium]
MLQDAPPRDFAPHPQTSQPASVTGRVASRFGFLPGLEGLRGLAVLGVLVFHAGFAWAPGGFLGVSTFFTLSGFLITSLLVYEAAASGSVSLRGFWGRRFRRLMPASLVCLLGVAVLFAPFVADASQAARLPGDVAASLFEVANWRFVV